jgi:RNA polymerase sigma factor (sigma-70 family)
MLTGRRHEAEDLFQETWIRVLEKGHQYQQRWKFETWLFSIARHLTIDYRRRRQPESLDALLEPGDTRRPLEVEDTSSSSAFEQAFQGEEAARVAAALAHLPVSYREVLTLRFHEDLELEEIARVVDSPLSTVKSRLYRGLAMLREWLKDIYSGGKKATNERCGSSIRCRWKTSPPQNAKSWRHTWKAVCIARSWSIRPNWRCARFVLPHPASTPRWC